MTIRDILRTKGREVVTISRERTVLDAMRRLVEHNIGAVVVTEAVGPETGEDAGPGTPEAGERVAGILTERDILRLGAEDPGRLVTTTVGEAMTREVIVGVPGDGIEYVMEIMTRNRIRHLPIVEEGRLRGIVSIGDVVNACRRSVEAENRYLRDYIHGVTR